MYNLDMQQSQNSSMLLFLKLLRTFFTTLFSRNVKMAFGVILFLVVLVMANRDMYGTELINSVLDTTVQEVDPKVEQSTNNSSSPKYIVVSVTDGDTFKVDIDGKTETVRLVGVNTPESVDPRKPVECFGREASNKLKALLEGQQVALQADAAQSDRDRYGRLLRFAQLENGQDVGLLLVAEGFAQESLYSDTPHIYRDEYVQAQQEAQGAKLGLWADDACRVVTESSTSKLNVQTDKSCTGPDFDCADFVSHAAAQLFFDGCGFTAENDPMNLDGVKVGDGVACESLP